VSACTMRVRTLFPLPLSLLLPLLPAACSSGPASPRAFYEQLLAATCARIVACCGSTLTNLAPLTEQACADEIRAGVDRLSRTTRRPSARDASRTTGRRRKPASMPSRNPPARTSSPSGSGDRPFECEGAFTGKVPTGGTCSLLEECADRGAFCVFGAGGVKTCEPRPGAGEVCVQLNLGLDDNCTEGLVCAVGPSGLRCLAPQPDGAPCWEPFACASGACDESLGSPGVCGPPSKPGPGEPCVGYSDCAIDSYCDQSRPDPICVAQKPLGAECTPGKPECKGTGSCVPEPGSERGVCTPSPAACFLPDGL
jgi:hypothetical protein